MPDISLPATRPLTAPARTGITPAQKLARDRQHAPTPVPVRPPRLQTIPTVPTVPETQQLRESLDELKRLRSEAAQLYAEILKLEGSAVGARQRDQAAAAAAVRCGKPHPGMRESDALEKSLDAAKQRRAALVTAVGTVEREITALVTSKRGELVAATERELEATLRMAEEQLDALDMLHRDVVILRNFPRWLNGQKTLPRGMDVQAVQEAMAAIRRDFSRPARQPEHQQPAQAESSAPVGTMRDWMKDRDK
jgi:hypothetical protein